MSDIREAFEKDYLPNEAELLERVHKGDNAAYAHWDTAKAFVAFKKGYQAGAAMQKEKDETMCRKVFDKIHSRNDEEWLMKMLDEVIGAIGSQT